MLVTQQYNGSNGIGGNDAPAGNTWKILGCLILLVALVARSWRTLGATAFYVEDALLFSYYYGGVRPLGEVLNNHFGQPYTTLISQFFAWIYAYADVRLQPYLYQWTGFVWAMLAACCLFFSGLLKSRIILLVGPSLMGLTALNHIYYFNTLIYVMYTAVILLLALLFYPWPKNRWSILVFLCFMVLLPWAGPYSVLSVPAVLALVVLLRGEYKKRALLMASLLSTLCYFLVTVQGNTTQLAALKKWGVVKHFLQVLLEKVLLFNHFSNVSPWAWLPVLLGIGGCFFLFRKDSQYIKYSLVMLGIVIASLSLFFLSIKFPLYLFTSSCHLVISLYFWCFFLLYSVDHFFVTFGWGTLAGGLFAGMVTLFIFVDNSRYPKKGWVEGIAETTVFLSEVRKIEQLHLADKNAFTVLKLDNYQAPFFIPTAIIGSRNKDAKHLLREQLPTENQNRFVSPDRQ